MAHFASSDWRPNVGAVKIIDELLVTYPGSAVTTTRATFTGPSYDVLGTTPADVNNRTYRINYYLGKYTAGTVGTGGAAQTVRLKFTWTDELGVLHTVYSSYVQLTTGGTATANGIVPVWLPSGNVLTIATETSGAIGTGAGVAGVYDLNIVLEAL